MKDLLEEIFASISKNKLRTALTGFSVAWGIFILIILLASGNGLRNGMQSNFDFMSVNNISIYPGHTSITFGGYQKNRQIKLKKQDGENLKKTYTQQIEDVTATTEVSNALFVNKQDYSNTTLIGVPVNYRDFFKIDITDGRFINEMDERENRKVVILHEKTRDILFRNSQNAIGEYVQINDIPFQVIGIYNDKGGSRNPRAYAPFQSINSIFNSQGTIQTPISINLKNLETEKETEDFENTIRSRLAHDHQFKSDDMNAIWIWDRLKNYLQRVGMFNGINLFIWIIGIGTLIAGIVGVGNIMLITVKERTHEFGIRKALGATPSSIIQMVLVESVFITSFFGYIGMVAGIGLTELISMLMKMGGAGTSKENPEESFTMFQDPTVDMKVVLMATAILIISGLIAGYMPARKAVRIKPIDALRAE